MQIRVVGDVDDISLTEKEITSSTIEVCISAMVQIFMIIIKYVRR